MLQVTDFLQTRLKKCRFRRNDRTSRSPARRFSAADQSLTFLFHKKSAPLGPWNTNFCQVDKSRQLNAFRPPRKSESCVFLWRKSAVDGQAAAAAPILMISTCSMGLNFGPSVPVRLFQSRSFRFLKIFFFFSAEKFKIRSNRWDTFYPCPGTHSWNCVVKVDQLFSSGASADDEPVGGPPAPRSTGTTGTHKVGQVQPSDFRFSFHFSQQKIKTFPFHFVFVWKEDATRQMLRNRTPSAVKQNRRVREKNRQFKYEYLVK